MSTKPNDQPALVDSTDAPLQDLAETAAPVTNEAATLITGGGRLEFPSLQPVIAKWEGPEFDAIKKS